MKLKKIMCWLTMDKLEKVVKNPTLILKVLKLRLFDPLLFIFSYKSKKEYLLRFKNIHIKLSALDNYSKHFLFSRFRNKKTPEPIVTKMLIDSLKQKKVFVDVGTHIGYYTCLVGKYLKEGKVYGFEVNRHAFEICKKNVNLNNLKNVEIFNLAVSNKNGSIEIPEIDYPFPGFSIKNNFKKSNYVNSISLDSFFKNKKNPDVIKIDVEGAELLVLKGMQNLLKNGNPIIFLELHGGRLDNFNTNSWEIISFLKNKGYNVYEIINHKENIPDEEGRIKKFQKENLVNYTTMCYAIKDKKSKN
jgi:FkbM family methyltransferase